MAGGDKGEVRQFRERPQSSRAPSYSSPAHRAPASAVLTQSRAHQGSPHTTALHRDEKIWRRMFWKDPELLALVCLSGHLPTGDSGTPDTPLGESRSLFNVCRTLGLTCN